MTPEEFVKFRDAVMVAVDALRESLDRARLTANKLPARRRSARPSDVAVGAILWHEREQEDGGWYWNQVVEVYNPHDPFKAYMADDGCRYGIEGAWVAEA